jgi:Domain of unknown function (DUF4349)
MFLDLQPSRPSAPTRRRAPLAIASSAVVAAVLLGTAACGSSHGSVGGSSASSGATAGSSQLAKQAAGPEFDAGGSAGVVDTSKAAGAVPATNLLQQRRLILDTSVSLTVGNVLHAAGRVRSMAAAAGGYVGDEQTDGGTGRSAHSTLTLRIPAAKVGPVTDQIAGLGTVRSRGQTSEDVTQQSVDVASRLATQKASIARVRALLARATKISDIILLEGELSNRESNLESLEAQLESLNDAVDLATLTVSLSPAGTPAKPVKAHSGFLAGLDRGWSAFAAAFVVALTVLGAALPFAALLALLGVPALLLLRRRRPGLASTPTPIPEP